MGKTWGNPSRKKPNITWLRKFVYTNNILWPWWYLRQFSQKIIQRYSNNILWLENIWGNFLNKWYFVTLEILYVIRLDKWYTVFSAQWAHTRKIQLNVLVQYRANFKSANVTFSRHDIAEKIGHLALNNNQSLYISKNNLYTECDQITDSFHRWDRTVFVLFKEKFVVQR
jgi:hypothetical protein